MIKKKKINEVMMLIILRFKKNSTINISSFFYQRLEILNVYYRLFLTLSYSLMLFVFCSCGLRQNEAQNETQFLRNISFGSSNLLVASSDYKEGNLSLINLDDLTARIGVAVVDQDSHIKKIDNTLFNLENTNSNVTRFAIGSNTSYQISTGRNDGKSDVPHDIVRLSGNMGLVTLNIRNSLNLIDLSTGAILRELKVPTNLRTDSCSPSPDSAITFGDRVYVTFAMFNYVAPNCSIPAFPGPYTVENGKLQSLSVADSTLTWTSLRDMPFRGPTNNNGLQAYRGNFVDSRPASDWIIITAVGSYGMHDGGVIGYDINAGTYETLLAETDVLNDTVAARVVSNTLAFAILSRSDFTNELICFNPTTKRQVGSTLISARPLSTLSMIYQGGKLYIGDRTPENPGIRVFELEPTDTCERVIEKNSNPRLINVGLPPYSFVQFSGIL